MSQPATPGGGVNPSTPVVGTASGHHQNSASLGGAGTGGSSGAPVAPGVQVLLDAEKEANRIVQQARQCTTIRVNILCRQFSSRSPSPLSLSLHSP